MLAKDLFTKEKYSGWYSSVDECFVSNIPGRKSSDENHDQSKRKQILEWCEEDNWIFNISKYKDHIYRWANSGVIYPANYVPIVNGFIDQLDRISVSRPVDRVGWGIPVPGDESQTVYVWFDALLNYLTVSKLKKQPSWPVDLQIIGKDIIRFHTVLWPAILLALDMELPKQILIHSHWLNEGSKMSKSQGNVVDPVTEAEILGGYEQLKYFLLSEDAISGDSVYDTNRAIERVNSHLVNIIGNLLSRITSEKLNPRQEISFKGEITEDMFSGSQYSVLINKLDHLHSSFESNMDQMLFHQAIEQIIGVLRETNVFMESQKPWLESVDRFTKDAVIYVSSESLRISAIFLQCFVPILAEKLLSKLSVPSNDWNLSHVKFRKSQLKSRPLKKTKSDFMLLRRLEENRT